MTHRRDLLPALTSLRFVAALLVFTWHCVPTRRVSVVFSLGYTGVAFFFLLSGFILTYTYHGTFRDRLRLDAIRAFYAARIARVYPLHLVMMPLMIACLVYLGSNPLWSGVDPQTRLHAVAAQALLVQSWIPVTAIYFGVNGPAWSISVEAFFYAVFPVAAFVLLRVFRAAPPYVVLTFAGAICAAEMVLLWPQHATVDDWRWYVFPPSRLADFVVGMLLAIAYLRSGTRTRAALQPTSVEVLAVAAVVLAVYVSPFVPLSLRFSAWVMPAWGFLILSMGRQRGAVSRALAHPVLVRLGEISFAFYLCHIAVMSLLGRVLAPDSASFVPLALASTLLASFALHHGVELPLRTRVRTLLMPRAMSGVRATAGSSAAARPSTMLPAAVEA
ncbi:MAG: acyltransferase 3 [Candidatus Eremiobacteraeota bacterium]|nr:acyltransferase 3 [Candidatus Eremiobacteraeota bacterium]